MDDSGERQLLDQKITALRSALNGMRLDDQFYVADRVLFSLAIDVVEHAIAVQQLRDSEAPRAAFANARAAFEATLDLALLVTDVNDYRRYGSLAYIHEVHENLRLQERFGKADIATGNEARTAGDLTTVVDAEVITIKSFSSQASDDLAAALLEFLGRKSGQKKHWSGKTREEIGEAALLKAGGSVGDGAIADAFYGVLSSHAHPRSRITQRSWRPTEDEESVIVRATPEDKTGPQSLAIIACEGALAAIRTRHGYGAPV